MNALKEALGLAEDAARNAIDALDRGDMSVAKAKLFDADAWIEAAKAQMKAIMITGRG